VCGHQASGGAKRASCETDRIAMSMATFRWRSSPFLTALALLGLFVTGFAFALLPAPLGLPFLVLWAMLVVFFFGNLNYSLTVDDRALTLLRGKSARWSIPWADLQNVRHEPGSVTSKNFDRLVLETESRTRFVTFNDPLFGRWNDPQAILLLLRERGYSV
jgi:hypothetical protein